MDEVNKVVGGGEVGDFWRCGFLWIVASINGRLAVYRLELSRRGVISKIVSGSVEIAIVLGVDLV